LPQYSPGVSSPNHTDVYFFLPLFCSSSGEMQIFRSSCCFPPLKSCFPIAHNKRVLFLLFRKPFALACLARRLPSITCRFPREPPSPPPFDGLSEIPSLIFGFFLFDTGAQIVSPSLCCILPRAPSFLRNLLQPSLFATSGSLPASVLFGGSYLPRSRNFSRSARGVPPFPPPKGS